MTTSMFDTRFLTDVAFDLFTSSAIGRYARLAKQAANVARVANSACLDFSRVFGRALGLYQSLAASEERDLAEVELAVLLAGLAESGAKDVDLLLDLVGGSTFSQAVWVAALARVLLRERTVSVDVLRARPSIRCGVAITASDDDRAVGPAAEVADYCDAA
ncbi:MAG: hypothetical protein ACHREM_11755 [Polyangiales bacterium]